MAAILRLESSDKQIFEVEVAVAFESQTIKNIIEDIGIDTTVPLLNVSGKMLARVVEYCRYHVDARRHNSSLSEENITRWNEEFVSVDLDTLFDLILAAKYLRIKSLYDLTCHTIADMIISKPKIPKGIRNTFSIKNSKTPEEIHNTVNIKNDITLEEEEEPIEIKFEDAWAFE